MLEVSLQLFFSYSHKDESLRDELAKHLTILERQGAIRKLARSQDTTWRGKGLPD
jgi:hypothetical protein